MRYLIFLAISVINLLFANAIFPNINIAGVAPDIIVCTMVSIIILENSMAGAWLGLFCGLVMDLFTGIIGFYTLPYFLTGAAVYFTRKMVNYYDRFFLPAAFAAGAYLIKTGMNALLAYMLNMQFTFSNMLLRYFLPEAAATAALMFLVHMILRKLYSLNYLKRKSGQDFRKLS
jgi:rod shape-determining protein MreD